jgi:hypothetical protein
LTSQTKKLALPFLALPLANKRDDHHHHQKSFDLFVNCVATMLVAKVSWKNTMTKEFSMNSKTNLNLCQITLIYNNLKQGHKVLKKYFNMILFQAWKL